MDWREIYKKKKNGGSVQSSAPSTGTTSSVASSGSDWKSIYQSKMRSIASGEMAAPDTRGVKTDAITSSRATTQRSLSDWLSYDTKKASNRLTGLNSKLKSLTSSSVGVSAFGAGGGNTMHKTSKERKNLQSQIKSLTTEINTAKQYQAEAEAVKNEDRLLKYNVDDAQKRLTEMKNRYSATYSVADNVRALGATPNVSREQKQLQSQIKELSDELERAKSVQYSKKGSDTLDKLKTDSLAAWGAVDVLASDNAVDDTRALGAYSGVANRNTDQARMKLKAMGYEDKDIEQLVDYRKRQRNKERYVTAIQQAQEMANDGFGGAVAASADSVARRLWSGLGTIDIALQNLRKDDRPIDYYTGSMALAAVADAERAQVSQNIIDSVDNTGLGETLAFLYQTGMSMADSAVTMLAAGAMGAAAGAGATATKAAKMAGLMLMGGGASTTAITAAKERGLSDKQALALGLCAGAAEVITEKIGVDQFLNTISTGSKRALVEIGKNALAEGSEEVGSEFLNLFADIAVSGDKSEWKKSIHAYKELGYDDNEALSLAVADKAKEIGVSFLGGALSGGVFGTAGVAINRLQTNDLRVKVAAATMMDEDTQSYRIAQQIQELVTAEVPQETTDNLLAVLTDSLDKHMRSELGAEERDGLMKVAKSALKAQKMFDKAGKQMAGKGAKQTRPSEPRSETVAAPVETESSVEAVDPNTVEQETTAPVRTEDPPLLVAAIKSPAGPTGLASDKQVKTIIADRASVEALGLTYGDGKVLQGMTVSQSRKAVRNALTNYTLVETAAKTETAANTKGVDKPTGADYSENNKAQAGDERLSFERFSELFRERFTDATDAEIKESYQDYLGSPNTVEYKGASYTLRQFRTEARKRNPDMTDNQIVELFSALLYEQTQNGALTEGGTINGEESERRTVGNGGGLPGLSVQRPGQQGGGVSESRRSGEGAVGERNAPDAERGVQEEDRGGEQEVSGESEKEGSSVTSSTEQTDTSKQAEAGNETPRTKPVSFSTRTLEVTYDRAVDAIKEAEEEVKSYASRIKKLGGRFDLASGDIRYRKKGGKRYSRAAGVTAVVSVNDGRTSVVVNAQKALVTVKHEFIHFMGDVVPGFRERLYQAFADTGEANESLDERIKEAYAKYEKLFGPFSEKTRADYYEEFFADVNADVNRIAGLDKTRFKAYQKLIQDTVETHEQIMLDVRAKERAARKAAREKAKAKTKGKDGKAKGKDSKFWLTSDLSWEELLPYVFARSEATENKPHGKSIYSVGMTVLPKATRLLQQVGLDNAPITANETHIYKNMLPALDRYESDSRHDVPYSVMEKLPKLLQKPVLLVRGVDNGLMVVTDEIDHRKRAPYVVVIKLKRERTVDGRVIEPNEVVSVYAKSDLYKLRKDDILFWDDYALDQLFESTNLNDKLQWVEDLYAEGSPYTILGFVKDNVTQTDQGGMLQRGAVDPSPRTAKESRIADNAHAKMDERAAATRGKRLDGDAQRSAPRQTIGEKYFPAEAILTKAAEEGTAKAMKAAARAVVQDTKAQENLGIKIDPNDEDAVKLGVARRAITPLVGDMRANDKTAGQVLRERTGEAHMMLDEDSLSGYADLDDDAFTAALEQPSFNGGAPAPASYGFVAYDDNGDWSIPLDGAAEVREYARALASYFGIDTSPGNERLVIDEWADEFSVSYRDAASGEWIEVLTGAAYDVYDDGESGDFRITQESGDYVTRAIEINQKLSAPTPQEHGAVYDAESSSFRFTESGWNSYTEALADFYGEEQETIVNRLRKDYKVDRSSETPYTLKADSTLAANAILFNASKALSEGTLSVEDTSTEISSKYGEGGLSKKDVALDPAIGLYRDKDTGRVVYENAGRFYYNEVPSDLRGVTADRSLDPTDNDGVDHTQKGKKAPGIAHKIPNAEGKRTAFDDLPMTQTDTEAFRRFFNDPTPQKLLTDPKTGGPRVLYTGTTAAGHTYTNKAYSYSARRAAVWGTDRRRAVFAYMDDGQTGEAVYSGSAATLDQFEFKPVNLDTWDAAVAFAKYDLGMRLEKKGDEYHLFVPNNKDGTYLYQRYEDNAEGLRDFNEHYGEIVSETGVMISGYYRFYGTSNKALVIDCRNRGWEHVVYDPTRGDFLATDDIVDLAFTLDYDLVIFENVYDSSKVNYPITDYVFRHNRQRKSVYNDGTWDDAKDMRFRIEEDKNDMFQEMMARGAQLLNDPDSAYNKANTGAHKVGQSETQNGADEFATWVIYRRLGERYGVISQTGRNYREVGVPRRTNPDNRVSKTASTVMGAKATPSSRLETIAEVVVDGKLSYKPQTDPLAVNRARYRIKKVGFNEAAIEWAKEVRAGKVSKDLVAMGATLLNNTGNTTDASGEQYASIMIDYADLLRSAGQALQAAKLLKNMTPEAKLFSAVRQVDRINEDLRKRGFDPSKYPDVEIDPGLVDAYRRAKTDEDRNVLMDAIAKNIADQIPAGFMDKFTAWRYLAMLGNFRTQVRNVVGNTAMQPARMLKASIAGLCEAVVDRVSKSGIERTTSAFHDKETFAAAMQDYTYVKDLILGGGKFNDKQRFSRNIENKRRIFKSKLLEGYRKATNWAMDTGDSVFCAFTYADALSRFIKANGTTWSKASEELKDRGRQIAIKEAAEATYRDNNAFSDLILRIGVKHPTNAAQKAASMIIEGALPFKKTPANILVRSIEYSPIGLVYGAVNSARKAAGNADITGTDVINQLAKGLTGTGLLILGFAASAMGLLVGKAPDDEKEKDAWEREGHQAYSFEVNGTSYTLDWLAPVSVPMFLGANLQQVMLEDGITMKEAISALQSISDPLLEMSMLQGIQDLIDNAANYGDDGSLVRLTASTMWSYLSQTVPTILGQAERTTELNRMQTYTDANSGVPTDWQYMVGKLSAKVPKWDYAQVVYTDAWGRTEANAENYTLNALRQFFSPGYVSDIHSSDMEKELSRLYEATGNSAVLISKPGKYFTYGGERVDLTADQYLTYNTTRGQEAYTALTALVSSTAYRNSSDEDKAALVSSVYSMATEIGKSRALGGEYQSKTLDKFLDVNRAGVSLADYVTIKAGLDLNGNGSISQTEASEVLDGSGLSSQQKAAMWKSINSGWKTNPYE